MIIVPLKKYCSSYIIGSYAARKGVRPHYAFAKSGQKPLPKEYVTPAV